MALTAVATAPTWLGGGDVDIPVRVRNTGLLPVRVRFVDCVARSGSPTLGFDGLAASMDADRNGDPFDRDLLCTEHWLPWRSSATHVFRIQHAFGTPDSMLLVVEVDGEREVLDVDLTRLTED
ncbi:hypothetical protein [Actinomyces polynesiensis]|uniref:hypothetical protein n=1 Tax=Actinomyces polynesiensis TaxID=1325934 RepID=UPI0005B9414D|nr:hypothetical protein [Actinomyces polynesiensis]